MGKEGCLDEIIGNYHGTDVEAEAVLEREGGKAFERNKSRGKERERSGQRSGNKISVG